MLHARHAQFRGLCIFTKILTSGKTLTTNYTQSFVV